MVVPEPEEKKKRKNYYPTRLNNPVPVLDILYILSPLAAAVADAECLSAGKYDSVLAGLQQGNNTAV